jgi:hypothetical protein
MSSDIVHTEVARMRRHLQARDAFQHRIDALIHDGELEALPNLQSERDYQDGHLLACCRVLVALYTDKVSP